MSDITVARNHAEKAVRLIDDEPAVVPQRSKFAERLNTLTDKERTVIRLIAQGDLNKIIAHKIGIHESGVKERITCCFKKLNCTHRTELVAYFFLACTFDELRDLQTHYASKV